MASASELTLVISAVGIDREGCKHILGIELGAAGNAAAVKALLTRLRDQGLPTGVKYLFVIDGAKALRAGIEKVFGSDQPVQRCRNHKMRNVIDELPREQHAQTLNVMRAESVAAALATRDLSQKAKDYVEYTIRRAEEREATKVGEEDPGVFSMM